MDHSIAKTKIRTLEREIRELKDRIESFDRWQEDMMIHRSSLVNEVKAKDEEVKELAKWILIEKPIIVILSSN